MQTDIQTSPVRVIRIGSLMGAARALSANGYADRAAELAGEARADLGRPGPEAAAFTREERP